MPGTNNKISEKIGLNDHIGIDMKLQNSGITNGIYDACFNSIVYAEIPEKATCLDVGCWTGNLGEMLINKKQCIVDGIDSEEKPLQIAAARGYRKVYAMDLNRIQSAETVQETYDVIIYSDVLEHVNSPWHVLDIFRSLLKPNGCVIISVPNIAFIQQRAALLCGRFNYNEHGGIMDASHLRFFTKRTLCETIEKSNYSMEKLYGYNLVRNRYFFLRLLGKIWPTLFAIQWLAVARNKTN